MRKQPKISVIIPALNEEKFLPRLLESLATQQGSIPFDVVVVDGQSEDSTVQLAKSFARKLKGLSVVVSPVRCLPNQRNYGARFAKGEWLVFSDADNVMLPFFMDRVAAFIADKNPGIFTTWFTGDAESPNDAMIVLFGNMFIDGSLLVKRQFTPGPLTIVRRDVFDTVGGFTENMQFGEDFDFGKKVHKHGYVLDVLRETLYVWSLRRFRNEGTLKIVRQYARNVLSILLRNKNMTRMPGYIMGGHIYGKKRKQSKRSVVSKYETKLKKLVRDIVTLDTD